MHKKPLFWVLFVTASLISTVLAFQFFSQAFPIVNLDLRMDRETALSFAEGLAEERGWGPESFRQAASFGVDFRTQVFVELEGGGPEAFSEMILGDLYSPYSWEVRHFAQGETTETSIWFTPSGQLYGFYETLPEDQPGPSLQTEDARAIAEEAATNRWNILLEDYSLVEPRQEVRPSGRTDHTFIYEREGMSLGEGRYRLRLTVAGDRFVGLQHFVKIPEAFSRRYQEMRSANDTIAFGASVAMLVLYILGGCIIGLFFLMRSHWIIWRQALIWGLVIGGLQFLVSLNRLPLSWMRYDTAISAESFLFQQIAFSFAGSLGMALLLTLSFAAAEGLSRKAFPQHLQLWKVWTGEVASTSGVLGRTVAGYLLVGVFFAYEVALYFFSGSFLGWWTPSDALFHPDALAAYFPWLDSIAISAQAGFWEESLFRAVPIAGAALLGKRFGRRTAWIVGAFILQALIFGGAHANYPAQPAFARLVELIIPSLFFGLLYLLWGLLPAVILHFAFDVVWFALPIFVSEAPGTWVDQLLIVSLALIPLWMVISARIKAGRWSNVNERMLNSSWRPLPRDVAEATPAVANERTHGIDQVSPLARGVLVVAGLLGVIIWISTSKFSADVPSLEPSRSEVESLTAGIVKETGASLESPWQLLSAAESPLNENDRFVWQEGGPEAYSQLIGNHLGPPFWKARVARFEGDVAERAEEWQVWINGNGHPFRIIHFIPEARSGATLTENEARVLAESALLERFGLGHEQLVPVASKPSKLPARLDWSFTYSNPEVYPLDRGEARIVVSIAGDEIVDAYQFVHVPEEWQREERNRRAVLSVLEFGCSGIFAILLLIGAVSAVVSWSKHKFSLRAFLGVFGLLLVVGLISVANRWPSLVAQFVTSEPFHNQAMTRIVGGGGWGLCYGCSCRPCGWTRISMEKDRGCRKLREWVVTGHCIGRDTAGL